MTLKVTSYGAAGTVTGSAHLVEMDGSRLLIDLGMFQGTPELEAMNREALPFDVRSLDGMIVTHGHLDHIGRLPLLVQSGYRGPIYATTATRDVTRLILVDSARVQAEDFRRQRVRPGSDEPAPPPMYSEQDVYETLDLIEPKRLDEPFLVKGVRLCFGHAGHILGSATVALTGKSHRFLTSGDLGHWGPHVVPDPDLPSGPVDVLMLESTYGNQVHPPMSEAVDRLVDLIHRATREGGNVLVPSFALERTQDVLHQLRIAHDKRRLPPGLNVFLDSPLGIRFTQLYSRFPEQLSESVKRYIKRGESPFRWGNAHFTISAQESREIDQEGGALILAGSGMANGGRILNHLKKNLARPESAVAFVGFQAEGTLGRQLVEGAEEVEIDRESFAVRAQISEIDGFSAHADQTGLLRWAKAARPKHVLLVHGEEEGPLALQAALQEQLSVQATISERGVSYDF